MSVQTVTLEELQARAERGMAIAQQIIKESVLAAGVTDQEYERGKIAEDVFHRLMGQGLSMEEADEYIDKASWEEIERRHREMYPQKYVDSPT